MLKRMFPLFCAILALGGSSGLAQVTTGAISGTIADETGGILPGATIVVRNVETGLSRTLITDEEGRYNGTSLPLGEYEVQAELSGFKTEVRKGIKLTVGRRAVVDLVLAIGTVSEQVVVTGEAPLVNTASATMAELVDDKKIRDLPLNGRDFIQLSILQPGVLYSRISRESTESASERGLGTFISISGGRPSQNSFLLDGTDINDFTNTSPGSSNRVNLGVEAIREFSVLTNTYSAEFGRAAGGVVNSVTKAGTNDLHGSLYEFHRNSAVDARNFFDQEEPPAFKRNQFGASAGGPIRRDRTFFFANYEGLRDRLGLTKRTTVPTADARAGRLRSGTVAVSPAVVPYLNLYPLPNGIIFGDTGEFIGAASRNSDEDYVMGRLDHHLTDHLSLFGRYVYDDGSQTEPDATHSTLDINRSRRQYVTLQSDQILSPSWLNTAKFAFNRSFIASGLGEALQSFDASLAFIPGRAIGSILMPDVGSPPAPGNSGDPAIFGYNVFQYSDDLVYTRGRHSLKMGANIERIQFNQNTSTTIYGEFQFDSFPLFLQNRPVRFAGEFPGSDGIRGWRQNLLGFYLQDDFQASKRLTLNLGLRYEFITVPREVNGKEANLRNLLDPTTTIGPIFENPSLRNFAPRLGLAWDPTGSGRTAVRAGFGIFYDQVLSHYLTLFGARIPPFFLEAFASPLSPGDFPRAFDVLVRSARFTPRAEHLDFDLKQPYRIQYNVNLQRQLSSTLVVTAGYVGAKGVHLGRHTVQDGNIAVPDFLPDGRLFFPAGRPKRNPNFAVVRSRHNDAEAFYNSFQLGLNKRFASSLQFQVSYSASKSVDDASTMFNESDFGNTEPNPWVDAPKLDRGLSEFDVRQQLSVNYTLDLPGRSWSGVAGKVVGGWQLGGIVSLASGHPFSVVLGFDRARTLTSRGGGGQKPNLVSGRSNNPIQEGNPIHYYDVTAFELAPVGFLGNLGRNTLVGPGYVSWDFSLNKDFRLTEGTALQFRSEFFNLFNRSNFREPGRAQRTAFSRTAIRADFGRITSTVGTSRQIQFALKLVF
ncbi:MAG: TonB-dependent receptor [Acidobacteria bacterium]|nr:TonB-dependent receptor [Acidobacteriota bacterium]